MLISNQNWLEKPISKQTHAIGNKRKNARSFRSDLAVTRKTILNEQIKMRSSKRRAKA